MTIAITGNAAGWLNWTDVLERVGGDQELVLELIGLFQEDVPGTVDALERAIANKDADGTQRLAHRLKGAAAAFSAEALVRCTQEIEDQAPNQDWSRITELLTELAREVQEVSAELNHCPFRMNANG